MPDLSTVDRRVLVSGVLAVLTAAILIGLIAFGPSQARLGGVVGLIGLTVVVQVTLLFLRPTDRSAFGKARSAFAAGEYADAARQLEPLITAQTAEHTSSARTATKAVPARTLLGNTYRQLGRLDDSLVQLTDVLHIAPKNAFVLYGLGRTRLAMGEFEQAAELFGQALEAGAPSNIGCDLGCAEYFAGNTDAALRTLQKTTRLLQIEPYRAFLANLLLLIMLEKRPVEAVQVALQTAAQNLRGDADGLAYWQAEVERHHATPYGQALTIVLLNADRFLTANVSQKES